MKHLPDTGKYLVFITRLFSMLWNTPFTCMSLPGELFSIMTVAMHIMTTVKESHVFRITPQVVW